MKNERRKRNRLKISLIVVMTIVMCMLLTACGEAPNANTGRYNLKVIDATSDFYVNDFAGVFTEDQKAKLMDNAVTFAEETGGIQVVITTVETLKDAVIEDGETTGSYTFAEVGYSMFAQYGIGKNDMGILILFSPGDREVRIDTGYQMQAYITDAASGKILDDYGMEYFSKDQFAEGLIAVQEGTIAEIKERVPSNWQESLVGAEPQETEKTEEETNSAVTDIPNEPQKDSNGNGLLYGFFGTIFAALAGIGAAIVQLFKGKSKEKEQEAKRKEDLARQKSEFDLRLKAQESKHVSDMKAATSAFNRETRELESTISGLKSQLATANNQNIELTAELEELQDKFERAQKLHPEFDFETEVHEMIEAEFKAEAETFDEQMATVLSTAVDKDNVEIFASALSKFDDLSDDVAKYVTTKREEVDQMYKTSCQLRQEFERQEQERKDRAAAQNVYDEITNIFNPQMRGNRGNFNALNTALGMYLTLSAAQKAFFPDKSLISCLQSTFDEAEEDKNNYTAAKEAESEVESIISRCYTPDEDDRDDLERAMRIYRRLSSAEQAYFSDELLRKLKRKMQEAEDDHEEQERRRRAARQSSMSSSSIHRTGGFSSGSRHSGFGGRPSGGGAGRKF